MKKKLKIVLIISPIILILDQITKALIGYFIPQGTKIVIWENFFDLVHTRNKGAAFGILSSWDSAYRDVFFYILAFLALCFLIYFLRQLPAKQKSGAMPIAMVLGGALGNIIDRIFRGSVIDFLSFHWYNRHVSWKIFGQSIDFNLVWPAFNVADSAITVGVIWLLIFMMFDHRGSKKQACPPK